MTGGILVIFGTIYILTIIYFTVLGCFMLMQQSNVSSIHGESEAKLTMTRTMGVAMFIWVFEMFIYVPLYILGIPTDHRIYSVLFIVLLLLNTPLVFMVMFAVVQHKVNRLKWSIALAAPFLIIAVWQILAPPQNVLPAFIATVLNVVCYIFLLLKFTSEYRTYVNRIQSEYSNLSHRQILWSWVSFSGLVIQGVLFLVYSWLWSPLVEAIYLPFSIINATYLCFCIRRQKTINLNVVESEDKEENTIAKSKNKAKEESLFATIEEKLKKNCEEQLLFLDPNLSREQLSRGLSISSTYLKLYFHNRGLTFYQYINTLRVEYAVNLMKKNPDMPIHKVSNLSGFSTQTTFRKTFQQVMGCLPSELKHTE